MRFTDRSKLARADTAGARRTAERASRPNGQGSGGPVVVRRVFGLSDVTEDMIATSTVFTALLSAGSALLLLAGAMLSRHKKRAAQGELDLVNRLASVERSLEPEGIVLVRGELWRARTRTGEKIGRGQTNARVVAARGTWLEVEACGVAPAPSSFPLLSSIKKSASVGRW